MSAEEKKSMEGGTPILTVVIVAYKSDDHIGACIESVLEAGRTTPLKIVVVDNASHDGTVELIRNRYPEVEVIENSENAGFARGVNQGVAAAEGRYLMILNPDTVLPSGTLEELLRFHDDKGGRCLVSPRTVNRTGPSAPCVRSLPHAANVLQYLLKVFLRSGRLRKPARRFLDLWQGDELIDTNRYGGYLVGAVILTSLDFFREAGMFDEDYFLYLEDADLALRVARAGGASYYYPYVEAIHVGGQSARKNSRSSVYFVESYMTYLKKHGSPFHGNLLRVFLLLFILLRSLESLGRGQPDLARLFIRSLKKW